MNAIPTPRVPASDTLIRGEWGYTSYGPRVLNGDDVEPLRGGQDPEFWGVYVWADLGDFWGWQWVADRGTRELAHAAAGEFLPSPESVIVVRKTTGHEQRWVCWTEDDGAAAFSAAARLIPSKVARVAAHHPYYSSPSDYVFNSAAFAAWLQR